MKSGNVREKKIKNSIKACMQKNNCLANTDFLGVKGVKKGKVRDSYDVDNMILLITTDRQSAFDRVLAEIPFKGQVLNQISALWFEETRDIVPNCMIALPDPNALLAKKCKVIPIEMVVRGYLTGSTDTSAWTIYSKGGREICGNIMPDGMVKNEPFERPIITPTTKSDKHDGNITSKEAVNLGLVTEEQWDYLAEVALKLFDRGTKIAAKHGLILVDTKYEFGIDTDGKIMLIDEVHTPDSSRYWIKKTYHQRLKEMREPENIDKEFLRLWFKENSKPYEDAVLPKAPDELVEELSFRYIKLYEMITAKEFVFPVGNLQKRMGKNLLNII
jgi:phosphoribosylaminoimidazole-succinocarboxamide synthase